MEGCNRLSVDHCVIEGARVERRVFQRAEMAHRRIGSRGPWHAPKGFAEIMRRGHGQGVQRTIMRDAKRKSGLAAIAHHAIIDDMRAILHCRARPDPRAKIIFERSVAPIHVVIAGARP